jgi:hypothetical protein
MAEVKEGIRDAIERRELPAALEPGGMAYMMSKQGHLNDRAGHWLPHLIAGTGFTLPGHQEAAAEVPNGKSGKILEFRKVG